MSADSDYQIRINTVRNTNRVPTLEPNLTLNKQKHRKRQTKALWTMSPFHSMLVGGLHGVPMWTQRNTTHSVEFGRARVLVRSTRLHAGLRRHAHHPSKSRSSRGRAQRTRTQSTRVQSTMALEGLLGQGLVGALVSEFGP